MTNEDIQIAAEEIAAVVRSHLSNSTEWVKADDEVAERLRSLVSQAYEEAARTVEAYPTKPDALLVRTRVVRWCAENIRALKDSLVQEPVSSLP